MKTKELQLIEQVGKLLDTYLAEKEPLIQPVLSNEESQQQRIESIKRLGKIIEDYRTNKWKIGNKKITRRIFKTNAAA